MIKRNFRLIRAVSALLASLACLVPLASCGGGKEYRSDLAAGTVCDAAEGCVPAAEGYYSADDADYLDFYFEGAEPLLESYEIRFARAADNINQFGVFKVKPGSAGAMKALCAGYIDTMTERWVAQADYIFDEHPKMENAEVRVFGDYVVYTMLLPADKSAVFGAIEELLKQK